jgi:hypothetical protein
MTAAGWTHGLAIASATLLLAGSACWAVLALWFQLRRHALLRAVALSVWFLLAVATLVTLWSGRAWLMPLFYGAAFFGLLGWWWSIRASNDEMWADEGARTSSGLIAGEQVTLCNVRNFDWRSRTDYTPRWETRHYDLNAISSVDLVTSYWRGPAIAHVLVSFGFSNAEHVVFSVEIRRRRDQPYSEIAGFFKGFNLSVIAADERDVIRVRTNIRGEDDYLYRVRLAPAARRALFCAYIEQANSLVHTPRFYNTLTVNCTTLVYRMMRHIVGHLPLDLRLVFSGYLPAYVYAVGGLDSRYTLEQLRAFGRITDRARQADRSPDFSAAIRVGIPPLDAAAEEG